MDAHEDPEVRARVFATVTTAEAYRIIRTPRGKPWCDAVLYRLCGGFGDYVDQEAGDEMRAGVTELTGFRP